MSLFSPAPQQEFPPLLFNLTPPDASGMTTPMGMRAHRGESMSAPRTRSPLGTVGSVHSLHTEGTPQQAPPPISRLDDVAMEDASGGAGSAQGPSIASLSAGALILSQGPSYQAQTPEYEDVWVTVYGFSQQDVPLILREFGQCGDILQWGTFGVAQANFLHIQYQNKYAAQRALNMNGSQITPSLIIGVKPLDYRHRAAIQEYNAGGQGQGQSLQVQRPEVYTDRPYRLEQSSVAQQVPQPTKSFASKVVQFVLGF